MIGEILIKVSNANGRHWLEKVQDQKNSRTRTADSGKRRLHRALRAESQSICVNVSVVQLPLNVNLMMGLTRSCLG